MTDINELKAGVENNPDDWGVRLQLAQAYKELGKVDETLIALWGNPLAPITLVQSRRVKELRSELDPEGVVDLGIYVSPVTAESDTGGGKENGERVIVLASEVEPETIKPQEKGNGAVQKMSALTVAIVVHIVIALLLGIMVISSPSIPIGPHTCILINPDTEDSEMPLEQPRLPRQSRSAPSSSALASLTSAISAAGLSMFAVTDFGETSNVDVTQGMTFQNVGSFAAFEAADGATSKVRFFSTGQFSSRRMVFIVEASRYMLTDRKGGIPAYKKVKEEMATILKGLNRQTAFNLILYDGKKMATYRDELVAATPSNVRQAIEWLEPINRDFEHISLGEGYSSRPVQSGVEPMLLNDLVHYIKATQRALEMDVDTIFLLSNGWGWHRKSMEVREYEKWMKKRKWGEDEEKEWSENVKKAREWLARENALRLSKGIPRRVVTSLNEIVSEILPAARHKPGPSYTMDEVQDQLKNAVSLYYRAKGKPRPRFNVVWFVGENESLNSKIEAHLKCQAKSNRGRMNVLKGLGGLENVSQQ